MEEMLKTLPQQNCSWLKGKLTWYKYEDFWGVQKIVEWASLAQRNFKTQPSDVFLCSCPKTGTTWLKALAFAIVTREKFDESTMPLLKNFVHDCVPNLEEACQKIIEDNRQNPLVATHLPYASLPESVLASNCKIVYIYRNTKAAIVSHYHFVREAWKLSMEDAPFKDAFEEFCEGISAYGPYWDHILGYWKARQERPDRILLLKYEDLKRDPISNVKRLAEFIGYPFSVDEEKAGVVDNIIKMCSFENMRNLEVNKSGKRNPEAVFEHQHYFRKAEDGDWKNYFTDEMKEKMDKLMDEKLSGTGLVLK